MQIGFAGSCGSHSSYAALSLQSLSEIQKNFSSGSLFNVTVLTTLIGRNKEQLLSLCDGLVSCEFYMLTKELVEVIVGAH